MIVLFCNQDQPNMKRKGTEQGGAMLTFGAPEWGTLDCQHHPTYNGHFWKLKQGKARQKGKKKKPHNGERGENLETWKKNDFKYFTTFKGQGGAVKRQL